MSIRRKRLKKIMKNVHYTQKFIRIATLADSNSVNGMYASGILYLTFKTFPIA